MAFKDQSIKRKTMAVMMLTTVTVLVLSAAAFTINELISYRQNLARSLSATAAVVADHSVAALALRDEKDARATLASLRADPRIATAALYDRQGKLFARFPAQEPVGAFPPAPGEVGASFDGGRVMLFEPVTEGKQQVGMVYLKSDRYPVYVRLRLYSGMVLLILMGSMIVALIISNALQRRITGPILALAEKARVVSERGDYSVRAHKASGDETGVLTDAFNRMLTRIEEQTEALRQRAQELEESRARLSAVVESAMDAIISVDAEQRITVFNQAAERMFGCPAGEAIGEPLDRFIPARHREAHHRHVAEFGRTGATNRAMGRLQPLSGLRTTGEEFPIEASISHIEVSGHHVFTVILRDITERKRAEDQVLQLNAELEQRVAKRTEELTAANKELESFTYSVAHDLRSPLRHIDAFSRILDEDFRPELPPEAQHYLKNILQSTARMSELVDDLLNLARVGRQELKRQSTPLGTLVDQVLADLKRETEGRTIEWHIEALPAVECDSSLMKQVFANLLSNAVKYTRPRPRAVIEVGCCPANGNTAVFVRDNGVGFNMKYADKLFGVFQRFHRSEDFEGTGVGLATVERIIQKHGGRIWADAAVDKGATFYFTVAGMGHSPPATAG
jgi:PAS domain S-box-containing protein